jgi:hypothetical protein
MRKTAAMLRPMINNRFRPFADIDILEPGLTRNGFKTSE